MAECSVADALVPFGGCEAGLVVSQVDVLVPVVPAVPIAVVRREVPVGREVPVAVVRREVPVGREVPVDGVVAGDPTTAVGFLLVEALALGGGGADVRIGDPAGQLGVPAF